MAHEAALKPRKVPQQARSRALVEAILEAAIRILEEDGAARFTTKRVADRAGVSVGSLYQYFPNKLALLRELQAREEHDTLSAIETLLTDETLVPAERMHNAIRYFFRSEADEADRRAAMNRAAGFYDAGDPGTREAAVRAIRTFLIAERLCPEDDVEFLTDLIATTVGSVAETVTSRSRGDDYERWADAVFGMLSAHLAFDGGGSGRRGRRE